MQKQINLEKESLLNEKEKLDNWINIPSGKKRMIHKIANHLQSDGRRGAWGSNFWRRLTNVAELLEFDGWEIEPCVFTRKEPEYNGFVGRTWGYSLNRKKKFQIILIVYSIYPNILLLDLVLNFVIFHHFQFDIDYYLNHCFEDQFEYHWKSVEHYHPFHDASKTYTHVNNYRKKKLSPRFYKGVLNEW